MKHALVGLLDHNMTNNLTVTSCLWTLAANPPEGWVLSLSTIGGMSPVHRARNMTVECLLQTDATHLLFVGSDHVFDESSMFALRRLFTEWCDKPIAGGLYLRLVQIMSDPIHLEVIGAPLGGSGGPAPQEPCAADYVGMDLTLIKRELFEDPRMQLGPNRWFQTLYDEYGKVLTTEDADFCKRARECGYEVWVDPYVHSGHWKAVDLDGVYGFAETLAGKAAAREKDPSTQPIQPEAGTAREVPEAPGRWTVNPGKQDGGTENLPGGQLESPAG